MSGGQTGQREPIPPGAEGERCPEEKPLGPDSFPESSSLLNPQARVPSLLIVFSFLEGGHRPS